MTAAQLTLIAFISGSLVVGSVAYLLRAVVLSTGVGGGALGSRRLRRLPGLEDIRPADGMLSRIDYGFNRLVLESGTQIVPMSAFLLTLCGAIAAGGLAWLNTSEPLIAVAAALAGMLIPLLILTVRRSIRIRAIRQELPHVLDMLARATRAGQSIEQAIELVAAESGGILGPEFEHCSSQLGMGRSMERVLKSMASRIRLMEMRILTTTLIVQKQAGGRLSDTLERMASVVRDRISAQRQIQAATSAGRASTLIIAAVAPLAYAFVYLFHREHLQVLFNDPLGRTLLLTALILELTGLAWVFYLFRREGT